MKLIDYIISAQNKSGSIKPSPNALKDLKASIEGIPFELKQPSMSGLFNMNNLLQGLQKLQQQMGSLENIGDFQQILQQIKDGTVTYQQLENALGSGGSLAAVLMNYQNGATPPTQITSTDLVIPNNEADVGPLFYTKNQVDAAFYDREDIDNFIDPMNTAIANNTLAIANNAAKIANNTTAIANINTTLTNVVHYDANTKITANGYLISTANNLSNPGSLSITKDGTSPTLNKIIFGTDNTGYGLAISYNYNGSVTDRIVIGDLQYAGSSYALDVRDKSIYRGDLIPASASYNLGASSYRWGTVYTSDLDLSNGIGDYTIVEGENDLFLYNNKQNKVYKFALIEVDPADATPKKTNAD